MNTDHMQFVFGSNTAGIHGAGAARYAYQKRGAIPGVGVGPAGSTYAIPTKTLSINSLVTLPLETIGKYVEEFLEYADHHRELQFQVTCIGCGLAGLKHEDIAPMFMDAPENCWFDNLWFPYLTQGAGDKPQHKYWGTF